jgi:hypothetical protein
MSTYAYNMVPRMEFLREPAHIPGLTLKVLIYPQTAFIKLD